LLFQDVPRNARNGTLQVDVYTEIESRLVAQCTYPASWTANWEQDTAEGDEFISFRASEDVVELLVMCYEAIGPQYFALLVGVVNANPNDWQTFEAMAFAVRAIIRPMTEQFYMHKLPPEVWIDSFADLPFERKKPT
jgi:hypothetical protein